MNLLSTIAIGQIPVFPGEIQVNLEKILKQIKTSQEKGYQGLVLPELCLTGYLIGDLWERPSFLREAEQAGEIIREHSENFLVIFGNVATHWDQKGEDGRPRKWNAGFVCQNQKWVSPSYSPFSFFPKTLSPNYREFDESRYFCDLRKYSFEKSLPITQLLSPVNLYIQGKEHCWGITICEDGWDENYSTKPFQILKDKGCTFIFNLSCSPFTLGKNTKRNQVFSEHAKSLNLPILYVNNIGIQNNGKNFYTFDGSSCFYHSDGSIIASAPSFQEYTETILPPINKSTITHPPQSSSHSPILQKTSSENSEIFELHRAISYGVSETLKSMNSPPVVIGLSGGIDSAVSVAIHAQLIPKDQLYLVNMPGPYTSTTTKRLAQEMAKNLNCFYTEIPITPSVELSESQFQNLTFQNTSKSLKTSLFPQPFHFENIQARDRGGRILAAIASILQGVFPCNGNKAEITVGYATMYGDLAGYLCPLGDLWKHQVFALGKYLNEISGSEIIPPAVFTIPPSAELSSQQNVDKGQGDPLIYPYHDRLFQSWVQRWNKWSPEEVLESYIQGNLVQELQCPEIDLNKTFPTPLEFIRDLEKWWKQFTGIGAVKRIQAPPILAISSRAYGFDHRDSLIKPQLSQKYLALKKKILGDTAIYP